MNHIDRIKLYCGTSMTCSKKTNDRTIHPQSHSYGSISIISASQHHWPFLRNLGRTVSQLVSQRTDQAYDVGLSTLSPGQAFYVKHQGVNVKQHIWHLETSNGMGVFPKIVVLENESLVSPDLASILEHATFGLSSCADNPGNPCNCSFQRMWSIHAHMVIVVKYMVVYFQATSFTEVCS